VPAVYLPLVLGAGLAVTVPLPVFSIVNVYSSAGGFGQPVSMNTRSRIDSNVVNFKSFFATAHTPYKAFGCEYVLTHIA